MPEGKILRQFENFKIYKYLCEKPLNYVDFSIQILLEFGESFRVSESWSRDQLLQKAYSRRC